MKILVVAGGTGGHVFPALCVAKKLEERKAEVLFATDVRGKKYLDGFATKVIVQDIVVSPRFRLYFSLLTNTVKALIYLLKNDFDAIVGFGGYPSVPFVFAGQILGKVTFVHEQNAVIGKANKLLSRFAKRIFTSFPKTKNLRNSKKIINVGMPTRFEEEYHNKSTKDETFNVLIFGGSQGATILSEDIAKIICSLESNIFVYHQVPEQLKASTKSIYETKGIGCVVESFFNNIDELYQKADLVISRSGASSVFEIIGFQKPAVLIPYKKSINGDQEENAKFLSEHNAAIVVDEQDIEGKLPGILSELIKSSDKSKAIRENLKNIYKPDVTNAFVDGIEKILGQKGF